MSENKTSNNQKIHKVIMVCWPWLIVLIVILFTSLVRVRLLDIPLERDEGAYAYIAQRILQGVPPFTDAYDIKMPGLYYVYALTVLLFGQTTAGIHLGLLIFNAATIVLIFLLSRRFLDSSGSLVAAASYAVMSLGRFVFGFSANAEHFLLLPALAGILLMLKAIDSGRLKTFFASGFLLGLSMVIKQQAVFFTGFAAIYLFIDLFRKPQNVRKNQLAGCALFALGAASPFSLFCLYYLHLGLFDKFWFWTFVYPRKYAALCPTDKVIGLFDENISYIISSSILLWLLAAIGLVDLLWNKKTGPKGIFALAFLVF
jgi:4-amino-4-deoxy-L-arabinose transferase-like glycosyltransferase